MSGEAFAFEDAAGRDGKVDRRTTWTRAEVAAAAANLLAACAIVAYFHDRFWWPPDDGAYAYVADALRNGAVLNRDLHDVHGGYVHFLHALALDAFGRDIVSLRYPLAILTVVQAGVVFLLLRPLIGAAAIFGGLAMSALTFVQFLNPTANWYALFLAVAVVALLSTGAQRHFTGLLAIGFAIGAIFFFRQLTGILVGMGTVAWLLVSEGDASRAAKPVLARAIAAIMALGLTAYGWLALNGIAFALYGLWPLAFLVVTAARAPLSGQRLVQILAGMLAGAVLAAAPLLLYHLANGSLWWWWNDTIVSAIALTELDFFGDATYATVLLLAVRGLGDLGNPAGAVNGAFWLAVLLAPTVLGAAVVRRLVRNEPLPPLAVVALFYAIVSAHYAIPIYALYSAGFTLVGLIAVARAPAARAVAVAVISFAVAIGLMFQAGEPVSRGLAGTVLGTRVPLDAGGIAGASVRMEEKDRALYTDLVGFIDTHAAADDAILGLPMTPELYFLSGRKPSVRFVIAPLGLLSAEDVNETWDQLQTDMPAVVVFRPDDKYTTPLVRALMDRIRPHYRLCKTTDGFELYAPTCRADSGGPTGLYGS